MSLVFVRGIHRRRVDSPHKGPVTRKKFPFDDVIMDISQRQNYPWHDKEINERNLCYYLTWTALATLPDRRQFQTHLMSRVILMISAFSIDSVWTLLKVMASMCCLCICWHKLVPWIYITNNLYVVTETAKPRMPDACVIMIIRVHWSLWFANTCVFFV